MAETPRLLVLAGCNGAGKSSVGGRFVRKSGGTYFNPDDATREILAREPELGLDEANSRAWKLGKRLLERAIAERHDHAFESTLGANSIPGLLGRAAQDGFELCIWYCGLESPERHLDRIAARVARGGHDIPEAKVRERYRTSVLNLIQLLPSCTLLEVYDNSAEQDPEQAPPQPQWVLSVRDGEVQFPRTLEQLQATPPWAKAIVMRAYQAFRNPLRT